jgi:osmotically-inducible protein OsmY
MRAQQLGYAIIISAISVLGACRGHENGPAGDNRVDKAANERAAQVTNTSDNKEGAAAGTTREQHEATATTGAIEQDSSKARATADRNAAAASSAIGDGWITSKIHARFAEDDVVKGRRIDVDTKDGVVMLKGSVGSKLEHDRAEELARSTDGVKRVVNNLMIDANADRHDVNDNHGVK